MDQSPVSILDRIASIVGAQVEAWLRWFGLLGALVLISAAPAAAQVPDYSEKAGEVFDAGLYDLRSRDGCWEYVEVLGQALNRRDPNVGYLKKDPSRTHVVDRHGRRVGADVLLYQSTGQVIDVVRGCGDPDAGLSWGVGPVGEYRARDWYPPIWVIEPPIDPPIDTPPPPTTDRDTALLELLAGLEQQIEALRAKLDAEAEAIRHHQDVKTNDVLAALAAEQQHHEADDRKPRTPWWQVLLSILAAAGAAR